MPPLPPDQQPNAPPPRGPADRDSRPHGRTKHQPAAQRDNRSGEAASPHQRHGDRGSGDDDGAARRALPTFVRYRDLVAAGIVANWTTLFRLIDGPEAFPPGVMIGPNTRAWRLDQVQEWLRARPTARKSVPEDARHSRVRDKRRANAAALDAIAEQEGG
jgi:hypothetical protein